jgi:hypothetical protein
MPVIRVPVGQPYGTIPVNTMSVYAALGNAIVPFCVSQELQPFSPDQPTIGPPFSS